MCVTSTSPLRAYVHREGLVRFATRTYDPCSLDGAAHLTNISLNSKTASFVANAAAAEDDVGHKWSLSALRRRFAAEGTPWEPLWDRIGDVIARTLIAVAPRMAPAAAGSGAPAGSCFELYGFDVLLDAGLKPWLLEVNTGPNLAAPTPLDMHIKCRIAAEMLHLVGITPAGATAAAAQRLRRRMQERGAPEHAAADVARAALGGGALSAAPLCVRQLVAETERAGGFQRVFPAASAERNAALLPLLSPPCAGAEAMCAYIAATSAGPSSGGAATSAAPAEASL